MAFSQSSDAFSINPRFFKANPLAKYAF